MAVLGGFINLPHIGLENFPNELLYFSEHASNIEIIIDYPAGPHSLSHDNISFMTNSLGSFSFNTAIHAPFSFNFLLSPCERIFEASLEDIGITAEIANKINSKLITVHLGIVSAYQKNIQELVNNAASHLEKLSREYGIVICVENLDFVTPFKRGFPGTLEEMKTLEDTGLSITLDTGHAFMREVDICRAIETFGSRIQHVHLHDSDKTGAHLSIGSGMIDFGRVFDALKKVGYEGSCNIEVLDKKDFEQSVMAVERQIH